MIKRFCDMCGNKISDEIADLPQAWEVEIDLKDGGKLSTRRTDWQTRNDWTCAEHARSSL